MKNKYLRILLFLSFLIAGLLIYKDYGVAWDEPAQRNIGSINYFFLEGKDKGTLPHSLDRYHGPAFELLLFTVERKLKLIDSKIIYETRHLLNFLLFYAAAICFYLLCLKRFRSDMTASAGFLFLIFSPRIFADAFYNSKDLPCLCFFIIGFYTLALLLEKPNVLRGVAHGVVCGLLMDVRLVGIILPFISFFFLLLKIWSDKKINFRKPLASLIAFTLLFAMAGYAFWPILWHRPFKELMEAFAQLSHYPWIGSCLFEGKMLRSDQLPWYYIPEWILVSTPPYYLFLFILGIAFLISQFLSDFKTFLTRHSLELIFLICLCVPLFSLIYMHSVVYDGWRHFYFIYPSLLLISVYGFDSLKNFAEDSKNPRLKIFFSISFWVMTAIGISGPIFSTVSLHPLQNVYFNGFAGKDLNEAAQNYEMDYWGVSYKEGLEYILAHDSSDYISVNAANSPGEINAFLLPPKERNRLRFVEKRSIADYFITNYRGHPEPYELSHEFYSVMRGNAKILTVFKTENILKYGSRKFTRTFYNDFESSSEHWHPEVLVDGVNGAPSASHVNLVGDNHIFSSTLELTGIPEIMPGKRMYLNMSVYYMLLEHDANPVLALSMQEKNQNTYCWEGVHDQAAYEGKLNTWFKFTHVIEMPAIKNSDDIVKIYVLSDNAKKFYIDDFTVNLFELDDSISSALSNLH